MTGWPTPAEQQIVAGQIRAAFMAAGWESNAACGMVAQAEAESSFRTWAVGDNDEAYGLWQIHWKPRSIAILHGCGVDLHTLPGVADQCKAVLWELAHLEKDALAEITKPGISAYDAGHNAACYYERPKLIDQWVLRAKRAEYWAAFFDEKESA
jgi:Phage tail lysozyme